MTTNEGDAALLKIIETLRDGQAFYEEAAQGAPSPRMRQLFTRMAEERQNGIVKLAPYVQTSLPEDESWTNLADRLYADFHALLGDPDAIFLDKLREYEAELLETIREASPAVPEGAARDAVEDVHEACLRTQRTMPEPGEA